MRVAEAAAEVMRHLVTHSAHGYSQPNRAGDGTRETISIQGWGSVTVHGGDYDCSSAVRECYRALGVSTGGFTYTGNERSGLTATGSFRQVPLWSGTQAGDILLRKGHTELVIEVGGRPMQAGFRHSEHGSINGTKGDQTGYESACSPLNLGAWTTKIRYCGPEPREGSDMSAADVWNYAIGQDATAGKGNVPAWQRLSWVHHDTAALYAALCQGHRSPIKGDTSAGDLMTRICYMDWRIREMEPQVAALTEAVKALAQAKGADPDAIAKAVSDAVKAKLESMRIEVGA